LSKKNTHSKSIDIYISAMCVLLLWLQNKGDVAGVGALLRYVS